MSTAQLTSARPHVCPPSNATHPNDRWESLFVYSFICKFTNLKGKEGLESPMDLEEALMSREPHPILTKVLVQFVLNLKPQARNISPDLISTTTASVLQEYLKTSERTIFWDDDLNRNVDPFDSLQSGFFAADWDFKLKVLRQLVELQLTHAPSVKANIDRAWGVVHNKHKKGQATESKPDASDPQSQENLQLLPVGQDSSRKRYWVADASPRVYVSTNPWKITATFKTVSSTREEYIALVEDLKEKAPAPPKKGQKWSKLEQSHVSLVEAMESRVEQLDAEQARVAKIRKKAEQRRMLYVQAELRETRTRARTKRPEYVYDDFMSEDEGDEYEDQMDYDDDDRPRASSRKRQAAPAATRRSGRTATKAARSQSPGESWQNWRGERRSTRLGAPPETQFEGNRPSKRAKTEDSTVSTDDSMGGASATAGNGVKLKGSGAAALKPTEMAVDNLPGKKKSKFWVYAVEPVPDAQPAAPSANGEMIDVTMDVDVPDATKVSQPSSGSNTAVDENEFQDASKKGIGSELAAARSLSPMPIDET
ncbi:hypothetical protein BKA70DRAFT_1251067 [Coprinopsis sp. MPI-PUGE-AT-0042]|nr:hypothetical protein BKA70DRAFT_1251067 [Coprinopsis sp. MPI-PUGE-AT-0042]